MRAVNSIAVRRMFKFWKKKVPAEQNPAEAEIAPAPIGSTATQIPAPAEPAEVVVEADLPEAVSPAAAATLIEAESTPRAAFTPDDIVSVIDASVATPIPAEISTPGAAIETESAPGASKRSWRERLSGSGFARGLSTLFTRNPPLDENLLDELETCLITADVGVSASTELVENLRKRMNKREFANADALLKALRNELVALLRPIELPLQIVGHAPFVLLMVGVNGVGKTTTIGKLARKFQREGHSVMLAAGDTFRAAAVEQLMMWGERNNVPVIAQGSGADSASVIFDALQAARSRGSNLLIADTAGRLHTQSGLMDELGKIRRVLAKIDASAPHEVLMVIDGTTGQNAINQVRQFRQTIGVNGLVVTKLDGTAKGGVVFALAREFGLPIRYVGLGEGIEDLRPFEAEAFVDGLLAGALGNNGQS